MQLLQNFELAVANSKTLTEKPDNETLLKLYSLYKQAIEGDNKETVTTNPFDFVAKFKQEAWSKLAGTTKENAMQQYIDIITALKN